MSEEIKQSEEIMLTTVDNPFDPFSEFDDWLSFDTEKGYNSCGLIDRVAYFSPNISKADQELSIINAIKEIVKHNVYGVHKIAYKKG